MTCLVDRELPGTRTGIESIAKACTQRDPITKKKKNNPLNAEKPDHPHPFKVPKIRPNRPCSWSLIRVNLQLTAWHHSETERGDYRAGRELAPASHNWHHSDVNQYFKEFQVPHSTGPTVFSGNTTKKTVQCCWGTGDHLRMWNKTLCWRCCCGTLLE